MMNKYFMWFIIMFMISMIFFYLSFLLSLLDYCFILEYELCMINSVVLVYVIYLDSKSMFFLTVVTFITSMVIIYSIQYMGYLSLNSIRFLYILLLFVMSMLLMILSPNLLSIMLGWDGLGLVSYCLVIYYNSLNSYLAGMLTCLVNRLGDAGLLVSISWMFSFGSWYYMYMSNFYSNVLIYLIVLSCFTKSAQVPFSCWLPAAMAAPTPVSSLVHSSTLVTAGVYLLIRFFDSSIIFYNNLILLSIITIMLSSFCANFEFDLKKIIAFSTLSQLGLMMLSLFLGMVDYTYFHLLSHAMFKSLLFLCSGIFIYYMSDNQDIRFMGSSCIYMPLTTCCFNISNMALCGIPFLSGFYSKDLILESSYFYGMNLFIFIMFYMSLGLTCCYTVRLLYYSCYKKFILTPVFFNSDFDYMKFSILILTLVSVFFGSMFQWVMNFNMYFIIMPFYIKILSLLMVLFGLWLGLELNNLNYLMNLKFYFFMSNMWFMYSFMNYFYNYFFYYSNISYKVLFWGEYYGPSLSYFLKFLSNYFYSYLNNSMKIYMISFFILFIIMII